MTDKERQLLKWSAHKKKMDSILELIRIFALTSALIAIICLIVTM